MDGSHFEELLRSLIASRRSLLCGSIVVAAGRLGIGNATAKKSKTKPKLKRNTFGCVEIGGTCRGKDEVCCSGMCQGKKPQNGKRDTTKCVGHDAGGCTAGAAPCSAQHTPCTTTAGKIGFCSTTTGNAAYCTTGSNGECFPCTQDAGCRLVCGANAACIQCLGCSGGSTCATTDICDFSP